MAILFAWLLADFISGVAHWAEDRLLISVNRFGFLEGVRLDNELHHKKPGAMLAFTLWQNINTTAYITLPLSLILFMIHAPTFIWLGVFFATFGNAVHRYSHMQRAPVVVKFLQRTGFLLSYSHHCGHHFLNGQLVKKEDSKLRFCVMTNWLNPTDSRAHCSRWNVNRR